MYAYGTMSRYSQRLFESSIGGYSIPGRTVYIFFITHIYHVYEHVVLRSWKFTPGVSDFRTELKNHKHNQLKQ